MIKWPWKSKRQPQAAVSPVVGKRNPEASRGKAPAMLLLIVDMILANGEFDDADIDDAKRIADTFAGSIDPGVIDVTGLFGKVTPYIPDLIKQAESRFDRPHIIPKVRTAEVPLGDEVIAKALAKKGEKLGEVYESVAGRAPRPDQDDNATYAVARFQSSVAAIAVTKADKLKLAKAHLEKARDALAEAESPAKLGRVRSLIKSVGDTIRYEHNRNYRKDEL